MSYIRNVQGKAESIPINEVNTIYETSYNDTTESKRLLTSNENMFSEEPISQIDTNYNNDYRDTLERLRTQTESMYMALESALIPSVMEGNCVKQEPFYIFNDTLVNVSISLTCREKIYCVDNIKFISNKNKRLVYDKYIHVYSQQGDTVNSIAKRFNADPSKIWEATFPDEYKFLDKELDVGIDINTTIPSTVTNLVKYEYIMPFICFVDGMALEWDRITISVDNKDVFLILDIHPYQENTVWNSIQENPEIKIMDIPFKISYFDYEDTIPDKYKGVIPIFCWSRTFGNMWDNKFIQDNPDRAAIRIYCDDPYVIYDEFFMDENAFANISTTRFGTLFNKRFADYDYRYKIKKMNLICFEEGILKDDFSVESHQFNILKISIDTILTKARTFKVFYNTRVAYDQDNMMRIKNKQYLADDFFRYLKDVNSNVQVFIDEIYALMEKDTEDELGLRTEIVHFNNMEEGSTPTDEFIYYIFGTARDILKELAKQIFVDDSDEVKKCIADLIDRAYINNYRASNPKNEWFIRKNLPEMFLYSLDEDYLLEDMSLLDEVFDFTYTDAKSYTDNLHSGLEYVIGYDADKLEASILRSIVCMTKSGAEVKKFISDNILTMSRWSMNNNNNYVMIFKNGVLYNKYNTISYTDITFSVNMNPDNDVSETDEFEFVFFLNANNNIMDVTYNTQSEIPSKFEYSSVNPEYRPGLVETEKDVNCIPCNTTLFDPENLLVLIDKISDNEYNDNISSFENTRYPLQYKIKSYKSLKVSKTRTVSTLQDDNMINGVYRVTKQGGGEYFIYPYSDNYFGEGSPDAPNTPLPVPQNITLASKRQFRYQYTVIDINTSYYTLLLNDEFKYCIDESHFMVFLNHRLVRKNSVFCHSIDDTPLDSPKLYIDTPVKEGDILEVFYITNDLKELNAKVENKELGTTNIGGESFHYDNIASSGYIRFTSPLYMVSSRHSLFVFLNGAKVPMSQMEDISATIIKVLSPAYPNPILDIYSHIDNDIINDTVFVKDGLSHEEEKISKINLSELSTYNIPTKLDKLLNGSTDQQLNTLMMTTNTIPSEEAVHYNIYSRETLLLKLLSDYIIQGDDDHWIANV